MVHSITDKIYYVGVKNPDLKVFDVIMHTKYGTSYNAYVIKGSEKTALVEMVKDGFNKEHMDYVKEIVPLESIDYIVMSHTEPDHSGSLNEYLSINPDATVVATRSAHNFLKEIVNKEFNQQVVTDGDSIDLGGVSLEFIMAPNLHWPDTMFTYVKEEKVLITGDMFGCHFAGKGIFDEDFSAELIDAQKYYFDVIISPFKDFALKAIDKIKDINYDLICPSHGPVLKHQGHEAVARFKDWAEAITPKQNDKKIVIIAYVSAYGYTKELAELAKEELLGLGFDARIYEITSYDAAELKSKIDMADALLVGSPTFNRDALPPVWNLLMHFSAFAQKGMPAAAFGSYGWTGEAVKMLHDRMKSLGMKVNTDGFRSRFKPSLKDKEGMKAFVHEFAKDI